MLRDEKYYYYMAWDVVTFHPVDLRSLVLVLLGVCFLFTFFNSIIIREGIFTEKVEGGFIYEATIQSSYWLLTGLLVIAVIIFHRKMAMKFQTLQFIMFILSLQIIGFQFCSLGYLHFATFGAFDISSYIVDGILIVASCLLIVSIVTFRSKIFSGKYMKTRKPVSEAPSSHSLIIKVIGVVVGGICISSIFSGNESSITSSMLFLSTTTIFYIQVYYLPYAFTLCMCKLKFASFQVKEAVISTHNTPVERRKRKEQREKNKCRSSSRKMQRGIEKIRASCFLQEKTIYN